MGEIVIALFLIIFLLGALMIWDKHTDEKMDEEIEQAKEFIKWLGELDPEESEEDVNKEGEQ